MTNDVPKQQLPRTKKTEVKEQKEDVLKDVLKMFNSWRDYTKKLHPIWERDVKLYNNERVERGYEGVSDTFVPMPYSTVEAIKAAIVTGDLSIKYQPQDIYKYLKQKLTQGMTFVSPADESAFLVEKIQETMQGGAISDDSLDVINALFMYYWESGDWDLRLEELVDSGLIVCNGSLWLTWDVDRPKLEFVPFKDFIFDPNATNDDNAAFHGRRMIVRYEELEKIKVLNPATQEMEPRYKNLDKIPRGENLKSDYEGKTDKEFREELLMGSLVDVNNEDYAELVEIQTKDRWYAMANRKVIIEDIENVFVKQAKLKGIDIEPFTSGISWANNKSASMYVGRSEISTFWKEAERLNDVTNQKMDAVTRTLLQTSRINPQKSELAKLLNTPGAVLPGNKDDFEYFNPPIVPAAAFSEEASVKNNIRETTATDQIVKGVQSSSDVTATEAKLQVASAGQRIELKVKSLERGPLKRLARNVYSLVRLFVSDPLLVPVSTNRGIQPQLFNPAAFTYDFEPKIQLNINAQVDKRREQNEAIEMFKILIQDPNNNLEAIKRIILPKIIDIDQSELQEIIAPPNNAVPALPNEMQPQPPAPMEAMA